MSGEEGQGLGGPGALGGRSVARGANDRQACRTGRVNVLPEPRVTSGLGHFATREDPCLSGSDYVLVQGEWVQGERVQGEWVQGELLT